LNSYIEKEHYRRGEEMGEHPSGRLIDSFAANIMSKPSYGAATATVCSLFYAPRTTRSDDPDSF
jgi:hypothetical protein